MDDLALLAKLSPKARRALYRAAAKRAASNAALPAKRLLSNPCAAMALSWAALSLLLCSGGALLGWGEASPWAWAAFDPLLPFLSALLLILWLIALIPFHALRARAGLHALLSSIAGFGAAAAILAGSPAPGGARAEEARARAEWAQIAEAAHSGPKAIEILLDMKSTNIDKAQDAMDGFDPDGGRDPLHGDRPRARAAARAFEQAQARAGRPASAAELGQVDALFSAAELRHAIREEGSRAKLGEKVWEAAFFGMAASLPAFAAILLAMRLGRASDIALSLSAASARQAPRALLGMAWSCLRALLFPFALLGRKAAAAPGAAARAAARLAIPDGEARARVEKAVLEAECAQAGSGIPSSPKRI